MTPEAQVSPDRKMHAIHAASGDFLRLLLRSEHPVTLRKAAYDYIARQELGAQMRKLDTEIRKGLDAGDRASLDEAGEREDERETVRLRLALVLNQIDEHCALDPVYQEERNRFYPIWSTAIGDSAGVEDTLTVAENLKGVIKSHAAREAAQTLPGV